jgi:hypothetical protein
MLNFFLTVIVVVMLIPSSTAFAPVSITSRKSGFHGSVEQNSVKREMFLAPQILFIGSCAVAVAAYAYTNLDAIMEVRLTDVCEIPYSQLNLKPINSNNLPNIYEFLGPKAES